MHIFKRSYDFRFSERIRNVGNTIIIRNSLFNDETSIKLFNAKKDNKIIEKETAPKYLFFISKL